MRQLNISDEAHNLLQQMLHSDQISLPIAVSSTVVELQEAVDGAQTVMDSDDEGA